MKIIFTCFLVFALVDEGLAKALQLPVNVGGVASKVSDSDIQQIMDKLWKLDSKRLDDDSDYQLDYQNAATSSFSYNAPKPLFDFVKPNKVDSPTVAAVKAMYGDFTPDSYAPEEQPANFAAHRDAFLDAVFQTAVFQQTYLFLVDNKVIDEDLSKFRTDLTQWWFGLYSRHHNGKNGSSGFEHIYIGEYNKNEVDGLHSWVRYYTLESQGKIDYYGHYITDPGLGMELQFKWNTYEKKIGGFFIGTSPEFDFCVLTICYLLRQGNDGCRFKMDGKTMSVTSWNQGSDGAHNYIATAYPDFG